MNGTRAIPSERKPSNMIYIEFEGEEDFSYQI